MAGQEGKTPSAGSKAEEKVILALDLETSGALFTKPDSVASKAKEKVILAIDLETSGGLVTKNGIVAVGWCAGDMKGNVLSIGRVCMDPAEVGRTWEDRCLREYWNAKDKDGKQPQLEQKVQFLKEAVPTKEAMTKFAKQVDELDTMYDVTVVMDNPAFDGGFLAVYYSEFLDRLSISHKLPLTDPSTGLLKHSGYRVLTMPHEMALKKQINKNGQEVVFDNAAYQAALEEIKKLHIHDHNPENDAKQIYFHTFLIRNSFK